MFDNIKDYIPIVIIEEDSIPKILLRYIEHNQKHYLEFLIDGKPFRPCARCFGLWIGVFIGFLLASPFWLGIFKIQNFYLTFTIAWLFALPSIIDWSTVKLGMRKGDNNIRAVVGFLHGLGIIVYFFIMPASIAFKILTYVSYELIFHIIRTHNRLKKLNKTKLGVAT